MERVQIVPAAPEQLGESVRSGVIHTPRPPCALSPTILGSRIDPAGGGGRPVASWVPPRRTAPPQDFDTWMAWDTNPLYALLHESIYCQGAASSWAAHRVRCASAPAAPPGRRCRRLAARPPCFGKSAGKGAVPI